MAMSIAGLATVAVFLVVAVPYSLLALVKVHKKKTEFPLNGREFSLLIPHAIGVLSGIVYYPIAGLFDQLPCAIVLVFECQAHSVALAALVLRCLRLLFLHMASQALLKRRKKPESFIPTWFVDHRHCVTRPFLMRVLLGWAVLTVAVSSLVFAFGPRATSTSLGELSECPTLSSVLVLVNVEAFVTFVALAVTAWRLRGVDDAYQIKQEILYLMITGIFIFASLTVRRIFRIDSSVGVPLTGLIVSVCLCLALYAITWFPLSLAKKEGEARDRRNRRRRKSLRNLRGRTGSTAPLDKVDAMDENVASFADDRDMGSKIDMGSRIEIGSSRGSRNSLSMTEFITLPLHVLLLDESFEELRVDFEKHLTAEFAFENLLFWAEAGHFLECFDHRTSAEIAKHAVQLYHDFVCVGAPYQANFDSPQKKAIQKALTPSLLAYERDNPTFNPKIEVNFTGHINKDIFDDARANVYRLMAQGAYIRWQGKNRDVVKRFLKNNPTSRIEMSPPSPSNYSLSRSLAYYSLAHKSTGCRPPSMKRERYDRRKGAVSSPSQSFLGASPGLPPPSPKSAKRDSLSPKSAKSPSSFDFAQLPALDSPSATSSCGSGSRQHMLVNHARGPSDTSTVDSSEFSDVQDSPTRVLKQQMLGAHQRDGSSLGFSETTTRFTFSNIQPDGTTTEQTTEN